MPWCDDAWDPPRQAGSMNLNQTSQSLSPGRVAGRVALRCLGLVSIQAAVLAFSPTTDPVGAGLELFFWTAAIAFVAAGIDGWRRPLRESLVVWSATAVGATFLGVLYQSLTHQLNVPWTWASAVEGLRSSLDLGSNLWMVGLIGVPALGSASLGWAARAGGRPDPGAAVRTGGLDSRLSNGENDSTLSIRRNR